MFVFSMNTYLATSTIHGLNHLTSERSLVYRVIWFTMISLAAGYGGFIIFSSWMSWNESPVLTTMQPVPIREIPLPGKIFNIGFGK